MKTRNYQWVIGGDPAMSSLFQKGYLIVKRETRHGIRWVYMMKETETKE